MKNKYLRSTAHIVLALSTAFWLSACGSSSSNSDSDASTDTTDTTDTTNGTDVGGEIDITDAIFVQRSGDCADYTNTYIASVMDIQNNTDFAADVVITSTDTECTISSDSVPNHNFNDETAAFAGGAAGATIAETDAEFTVSRSPEVAAIATGLTQETKNGVFLNGVVLDILSAGCYKPNDAGADDDGNVNIGCSSTDAWLLDPLGTESKFGADQHNAHTQPGGLYHYHGSPLAMYDDNPDSAGSPVIGFAADGFPIYGSYFKDSSNSEVRKAVSGYTLKSGSRGTKSDTNPGGDYDGTYVDDWEFTNAGDLDACNGMTVDGQYGYYAIEAYPWVMGCISGTPHESFGGGNTGGGPPNGGPPGGV